MAKMIPDYIDQEDPRRNGERMVFEWFSEKRIPGIVYYSVDQKNQKRKLIGEIDFLYASERGFLCVEVKGGEEIYRQDRKWFSVNKLGVHNEIHNPFKQAKDCQYALKKYLSDTYGKNSIEANCLVGYAVIFPECIFTGKGNDLVTEVMYDSRRNLGEFLEYINDVYDYWERLELERHESKPTKLTPDQFRHINDLIRGDFHVVPSMNLEFQHIDKKMTSLLEEQYDVLDNVEDNARVIVKGAAGTGKTLLAVELVRKNVAKGNRTLYLCFNSNMSEYASNSLKDTPEAEVFTFHSLAKTYLGKLERYDISIKELGNLIKANENIITEKYDSIIIDEGQDLFCVEFFDVIDIVVEGGLEKGKWVVFLDPNQNIFNENSEYRQTMEYLSELYSITQFTLSTNCRNTQPIASRTAAVSKTPPAKNLKLSGPNVVTRTYSDRKEYHSILSKEIQSLLASGISPADIVVLSRYRKENSMLSDVSKICNLEIVEKHDLKGFGNRCLKYYTVQSFKGLESKIVFYVEVDGFEGIQDRMLNYVAMSRACLRLYLMYNEERKEEYQTVLDEGIDLLG